MSTLAQQTGDGPVFIVGTSRSGTTLLAACLGRSESLHIGAETHYFDDLRPRLAAPATGPLPSADAERCESYFMALAHGVYGTPEAESWRPEQDTEQARVERSALRRTAAELGGSADAWFEAFCRLQAKGGRAQRWGEKTPRHAFRIPEILDCYPNARIICMVRDPRAVVASYAQFAASAHREGQRRSPEHEAWAERDRERIRRSHHPLILALLWRGTVRAAQRARQEFGEEHVRMLRFESLLEDPSAELAALCQWLRIDYDPRMITTVPQMNSSFVAKQEGRGLSREAADRWRESLSSAHLAAVQHACRGPMRELDYPALPVRGSLLRATGSLASLPLAAARAFAANRARFGSGFGYVARRLRLAVGGRR